MKVRLLLLTDWLPDPMKIGSSMQHCRYEPSPQQSLPTHLQWNNVHTILEHSVYHLPGRRSLMQFQFVNVCLVLVVLDLRWLECKTAVGLTQISRLVRFWMQRAHRWLMFFSPIFRLIYCINRSLISLIIATRPVAHQKDWILLNQARRRIIISLPWTHGPHLHLIFSRQSRSAQIFSLTTFADRRRIWFSVTHTNNDHLLFVAAVLCFWYSQCISMYMPTLFQSFTVVDEC